MVQTTQQLKPCTYEYGYNPFKREEARFCLFLLVVSVCLQKNECSKPQKKKLSRTSRRRFGWLRLFDYFSESLHCFYVGSCVAACSTSHARQISSEVLEKDGNCLPTLGVGHGAETLNSQNSTVSYHRQGKGQGPREA